MSRRDFLVKKNVPWHILAPRRGCFGNHLPLRRVRILAERFCMIGRNFLSYKKTADQFDQLLLNAVLRIFRCTLMILAIDSEALPLLLYTVFCRK